MSKFHTKPTSRSWQLPGFEIWDGDEFLTTAATLEDADKYIEASKKMIPVGTQVRASSGFIGQVIGLEMNYHTGDIVYMVNPTGFTQHDGRNYAVSWWGSSLDGTKPIEGFFGKEKLP